MFSSFSSYYCISDIIIYLIYIDLMRKRCQLINHVDVGLDRIQNRIIRECSDLISPYITIIFNLSLSTGVFPDNWKSAKVTPVFKQGDECDMNNYRPISVISCSS